MGQFLKGMGKKFQKLRPNLNVKSGIKIPDFTFKFGLSF